jgi:hypothetical protein
MIKIEPMTITITSYGKKVTAEIPGDSDMNEVAKTIKGLLVTNNWGIELVNEYIKTDDE